MKKTITFFSTRAAMMLLTTLLLTLTAQTAWAQSPFDEYFQNGGTGGLTITEPGEYDAYGTIDGNLIIGADGVTLNVNDLTVNGDIILSSGTLSLSVSDEKRIEAQTINATDLTMTGGSITCSDAITFESGEISNGRIDAHTINATTLTMTGGIIGPETLNASTLDMSGGIVNAGEINARGGTISGGRITATGQFDAGASSSTLTISDGTIISGHFRICNLEIDALTGAPSITAGSYSIEGDLSITGFVTDGTNVYDGSDHESVESLKEYLRANGGTTLTKAEVYSVVFNANADDYEGTMSEQIFMVGERKALSECTFTREGYMFDGWAESLDGSVKYADEEEVEDLTTSGETKILYAHWTQGRIFQTGTYNVDADTDIPGTIIVVGDVTLNVSAALTFGEIRPEGEGSLTLNVSEGGSITSTYGIDADEFNMTGGTVNAFSLSADAGEISGGTLDITNVFITHDNIISGGNITVRNYLQINGDLQFKAEHANMSIYAKEYDFNIGSLTIIGSRGFSDGMTVYNPGTIANNNISSLNEKTLKPAYTVSYDANGGTGDVASQTKCSDIDIPLASAGFTRTGYTLDGWATSANGAKVYELGGTYSANADLPLYAHWTAKTYTVTLNRQGATTGSESVTATYGADMPAITPPTMLGYTFDGYFTETDGGGIQYYNADGTSTRPWDIDATTATTLYANWEIINFEIDGITYEWTREMNVKVVGYNGALASITILPSVEHNGVSYNVTEIGEGAFEGNTVLDVINTYNSIITVIRARAFMNCSNLSKIDGIHANLTTIEAEAFSGSGLTEFTFPECLTTIQDNAFSNCGRLTIDLSDIPTSVTSIGTNAFNNVHLTATLTDTESGNALERLSSVFDGYDVEANFTRGFSNGVASTVCLPFDFTPTGGTYYTFDSVDENWTTVTMKTAEPDNRATTDDNGHLQANTPYLFMPAATGEQPFSGTVTCGSTTADVTTVGDWTFTGTYEEKRWDVNDNNTERRIFGFATGQGYEGTAASTAAGEFIRLNSGGIKPFRAYLEYTGSLQARTRGEGGLPETMTVRLVNANGEIQGIGEIRLNTGEVTFDSRAWYDLNGRRLDGKPSEKGIYINGGRKVVIK